MKRQTTYSLLIIVAFAALVSGCKKDETAPPVILETGTMTDIQGNVYRTVKIGNQWWMAENLKVTRYRDSSAIAHVGNSGQSDSLAWVSNTTGAYTEYPDNNHTPPGLLYNWYTVTNTLIIAPAGWHIPTDAEWKELERSLGMSAGEADNSGWRGTDEGEKLKIAAPDGWTTYQDVWATNESGFTALAGSCRLFNGAKGDPGLFYTGFWWTASERTSTEAWYRYLDYKNPNVFRSACSKNYGYSIRCVKD